MQPTASKEQLDVLSLRKRFPILNRQVQGQSLIYFDNAATSQKPDTVIEALNGYYQTYNSNVHRGAHTLAEEATEAFENSRKASQKFLNAAHTEEIIFTKGTTEGINLTAASFGEAFLREGDEIILSTLEHHSNIVPWQLIAEKKGAKVQVIPINDAGELILEEYEKLLSEKTKIVAVNYVSNALGTINPVREIISLAHKHGAKVLLDGAQATHHMNVDVQDLDCDFLAFSGHKMYGPTGIGVLYGKRELLEQMPPYAGGGEMIKEVSFERTTFNDLPHKFEAGTPNIADTVALKAAFDFISETGIEKIANHEHDVLTYATERMQEKIKGLKIYGTAKEKASVISFMVEGVHHYDLGMMLDARGVAIRTGHHCAQPLMARFGIPGTARASFAAYNTREEADNFVKHLSEVCEQLQ